MILRDKPSGANKSIFNAIVGERCELNALGREVKKYWRELPTKYPELEFFDFVVMPNHFYATVRIHYRPTNREHHLGFLMSRFKGGTGHIYGKFKKAGLVEDIGEQQNARPPMESNPSAGGFIYLSGTG